MIIYAEGATDAQAAEAEYILGLISTVYPGHPWGIRVMEGGFFIQYLLLPFSKPYGMFCKYSQFGYSASAMKREIIMMAGEWLERSGMARGRHDADQEIEYVDGVPDRHQRRGTLVADCITVEPDDSNGVEIRDVPRPQALKP